MRALVYHGPGERGWDTVDDPTIIDATDIIVRVDTSTICGTDLHILKGDVPETTPGTVLAIVILVVASTAAGRGLCFAASRCGGPFVDQPLSAVVRCRKRQQDVAPC